VNEIILDLETKGVVYFTSHVPKKFVDDLEACIQYLHQQLEDGTIGHRISNVFGKWFLYDNNQVSFLTFIL
jgi:hypothetical protein